MVELGDIFRQQRLFDEALNHQRQALDILRQTGNQWTEAWCRRRMAWVYSDARQFDDAIEQLRGAIVISRDIGDRFNTAKTLGYLGDALSNAGHTGQARESWHEALALFEELRSPRAEELHKRLA